jgi:hypothetical protein
MVVLLVVLVPRGALAVQCEEVANMELAGVPTATVIRELGDAGAPIDVSFIRCLADAGVSLEVIRAAWRLHVEQPEYPEALEHVQEGMASGAFVQLDVMCGSVSVRGTDARATRIVGRGPENAVLDVRPTRAGETSGPVEGLVVAVRDARTGPPDDPAALPRFERGGSTRPELPPPCADLTLEVPRSSRFVFNSGRADLSVRFVDGPLELNTHFGDIDVVGQADELILRTTSGNVRADTASKQVDIETVSGRIELSAGKDARVKVSSISGPIWVWGGPIRRIEASSVSGDIRMNASMADAGLADLETHKGDVEARVPDGDITARSHEGIATGPAEMVRPDGYSVRQLRSLASGDRFGDVDQLDADVYGIWAKSVPERWWFRRGAVLSSVLSSPVRRMQLSARSFSGDVTVVTHTQFPAPTGPLIAGLEGVADRVEACAAEQVQRHPGAEGHAVLTFTLGQDGGVDTVSAPARASVPAAIEDGRFASCLVRAVEKQSFDGAEGTTVRWPVPFGAPDDPKVRENQRAVSAWIEGSGSLRPDRWTPPTPEPGERSENRREDDGGP